MELFHKGLDFDRLADEQAARIYEKLDETEVGTKEYRELQNQLGAFEIMKEKRRNGTITKAQWVMWVLDFLKSTTTLGLILTADFLLPRIIEKLKLNEGITRLFK
jgi:hypothetical protein